MSYENAPATKLIATHCAVCARPLVDAVSVETGIGPVCREKFGFDTEVDPVIRKRANELVYLIAAKQVGLVAVDATRQLRDLGFPILAERIATRLFEVVLTKENGMFAVVGPYTENAVNAFRRVPGRRWNKELCRNEVPEASKPALWAALKVAYPGYNALAPDGSFFQIPA